MAEPTRQKPGLRTAKPRSSLARTVLKVTAVAIAAVALLWSALFVDLVRKRSDAGAGSPRP